MYLIKLALMSLLALSLPYYKVVYRRDQLWRQDCSCVGILSAVND